ncbi:Predicted ATP-binding protein involved in virulence [Roseovarius pacificus]|uniref:Predicted ATP-binding protein involved in virulence n=1 Tax=Roseovarius pacificus TaxID=337701 RepID=A0A1M7KJT7_9RHOB|nr:ATP-binding protein [Roseovarius pacificus]GGO62804.1 hypothetical protein GCM10011315_42660 [Roseovarius pacificus]SHM65404.1 Predicted ATP-binding protein involved in virulence [Roseovarius pacificus]
MNTFSKLKLSGWRQFENVDLDLSKNVTVLTGANGTGKTSILNILSTHFGWKINFAATPYVSKRSRKNLFRDIRSQDDVDEHQDNRHHNVGHVEYSDGQRCDLTVPELLGANYQLKYQNRQAVPGIFIPSHRQQSVYSSVSTIPTQPVEASQMYENYRNLLAQFFQPNQQTMRNPGTVQKEALISLAVFGEGNKTVVANQDYEDAFRRFESRLRTTLPKELGFQRLKVVMPEVVLETNSGDFSLDAMSGGVSSVFSIVWQIHMFDLSNSEYTIVLDEPENHLHPSMQRTLLPSLSLAFPHAKFVVATHSPFIVSSFREANVYALFHGATKGVEAQQLTEKDLSGSASSVLREILGLETTMPVWAEEVIASELEETSDLSPQERATRLVRRMRELGISNNSNLEF